MKHLIYWWLEYLVWRRLLAGARKWVKRESRRRVMIVPCEPWSVIGSRGDEAMITAIVESEMKKDPSTEFVFITGGAKFDEITRFPNARFVFAWCGRLIIRSVVRAMDREAPDVVYTLGADCMDGKYSPRTSMVLVAVTAYAAACGAETHLTGFSFNECPTPRLRRVFRAAARFMPPFNLRDAVSKERFDRFAGVKSQLVADVAFLMRPKASEATERWAKWCDAERNAGHVVVGVNLNPMLFPKDAETRKSQIARIAKGLVAVRQRHPGASLLLVPHDYRRGGDPLCLEELYEDLSGDDQVKLVKDDLKAPELKELAGSLDALFTCRMHLAIATLGRGKPISGFAYQGKFAGLLKHFGLPGELAGSVSNPESISDIVERLVRERESLTAQVQGRLPAVLKLSALNVES